MTRLRLAWALAVLLGAPAAHAEGAPAGPPRAAGTDLLYSSDAEDSEVLRAGVNLDWHHASADEYRGIRLEQASFKHLGQRGRDMQRAYVRMADSSGGWKWNAALGTDGRTALGAVSIHNEAKVRQEYFVEREIVETPRGLSRGIYYTFAGASVDLPLDERNVVTSFAGMQEFTGDNLRLHLRGNYVHVLKPEWGLSAQLRTRYFHNSDPREYDYYSPRWYAQLLPVIQMRRYVDGWQLLAAAGRGAQRDATSGWQSSTFLNARATSPALAGKWRLKADLLYSNTPVSTGFTYSYRQLNLGVVRQF